MRVEANVRAPLDLVRCFNRGHPAPAGKAREHAVARVGLLWFVGEEVVPLLAAVACQPEMTVVRAGPEDIRVPGRLGNCGRRRAWTRRKLGRDDLQVVAAIE